MQSPGRLMLPSMGPRREAHSQEEHSCPSALRLVPSPRLCGERVRVRGLRLPSRLDQHPLRGLRIPLIEPFTHRPQVFEPTEAEPVTPPRSRPDVVAEAPVCGEIALTSDQIARQLVPLRPAPPAQPMLAKITSSRRRLSRTTRPRHHHRRKTRFRIHQPFPFRSHARKSVGREDKRPARIREPL